MITVPGWARAAAAGRFSYLRPGMTVLLGYIGGKMSVAPVPGTPPARASARRSTA
jgi:hypothetical protein